MTYVVPCSTSRARVRVFVKCLLLLGFAILDLSKFRKGFDLIWFLGFHLISCHDLFLFFRVLWWRRVFSFTRMGANCGVFVYSYVNIRNKALLIKDVGWSSIQFNSFLHLILLERPHIPSPWAAALQPLLSGTGHGANIYLIYLNAYNNSSFQILD